MARVRFFAQARQAAGVREAELPGHTVVEVLEAAIAAYGDSLAAVLEVSAVWLNGQPAAPAARVGAGDVIAVLPPVSGGGQ